MKTIIFVLIAISSYSINSYSQSQWFWVNPYPQGHNLLCIQYINSDVGFASGDGGIVMKTTNAGINWRIFNTGSNISFHSIFFLNEMTGFAVGGYYESLIKKTTNGGESWVTKDSLSIQGYRSVYFTDLNTGYAVGNGRIKKTTTAGETWFSQNSGVNEILPKVFFLNHEKGFILSYGTTLLETGNGGDDWRQHTYDFTTTGFSDFCMLDSANWYFLGFDGAVFKTTDGGYNWDSRYTGVGDIFRSIFFLNRDTGFIAGDNYIRKTTNGGITWSSQTFMGANFNRISFPTPGLGLIVGLEGIIYKSGNQGSSWTNIQSSATRTDIHSIRFLNEFTGFAVGGTMYGYVTLKTTDKGITWMTKNSGANYTNYSIDFINDLTGYVANSGGKLFKTTDGGDNWTYPPALFQPLRDIKFVNSSTGYLTSSYGSIFKSVDGGSSWSLQLSGSFYSLNTLFFLNENTGYAAGDGGEIFKTTNGGVNWDPTPTGTTNNRNSIFFTNPLVGYSSGTKDLIKTTNGGNNWIINIQSTNEYYSSLYFINSSTGYCTRSGGASSEAAPTSSLLKTTNAGGSWSDMFLPTNYILYSLYFLNPNLGFIGGEKGTILSTNSELTGNILNGTINTENFILNQNYPNPFNPKTIISYQCPMFNFVSIKVYDVLGNEVANLVDEKENPGVYRVEFDGSNFSSGVYFYRLVVDGNIVGTKRMVLLR